MQLKYLSLFSGAGGGDLGAKLLGWKCVGYCDNNAYCQKVLRQRIADGILDPAPIFGDIRKFISEGYADAYKGMVDIITAGFPCQDFSVVGKRLAGEGDKNMWPETVSVIRIVRPDAIFLENVPGLLSSGYIFKVFDELREAGYEILPPVVARACDVGADHERERVWIFAYAPDESGEKTSTPIHPSRTQRRTRAHIMRSIGGTLPRFDWTVYPPRVVRELHGLAHRVDRVSVIGNGQVPLCMAYAFSILFKGVVE